MTVWGGCLPTSRLLKSKYADVVVGDFVCLFFFRLGGLSKVLPLFICLCFHAVGCEALSLILDSLDSSIDRSFVCLEVWRFVGWLVCCGFLSTRSSVWMNCFPEYCCVQPLSVFICMSRGGVLLKMLWTTFQDRLSCLFSSGWCFQTLSFPCRLKMPLPEYLTLLHFWSLFPFFSFLLCCTCCVSCLSDFALIHAWVPRWWNITVRAGWLGLMIFSLSTPASARLVQI